MIRRADFREVKPTADELADWAKRYPRRLPVYRAEHVVCGKRIWYSGVAIGSHLRACGPAAQYHTTDGTTEYMPVHAHTEAGPARCARCQLCRDMGKLGADRPTLKYVPLPGQTPEAAFAARLDSCAVCGEKITDTALGPVHYESGLHRGADDAHLACHELPLDRCEAHPTVVCTPDGDTMICAVCVSMSDGYDDESCPRCKSVNWGQTPAGEPECVTCGYVERRAS